MAVSRCGKRAGKELILHPTGKRVNWCSFLEEQIGNIYQNFKCTYLTPAFPMQVMSCRQILIYFPKESRAKMLIVALFTAVKYQKQAKCP